MKEFYIIKVTDFNQEMFNSKISQDGYKSLKDAQQFIESRNGNPKKINDFAYMASQGDKLLYEIFIINVN